MVCDFLRPRLVTRRDFGFPVLPQAPVSGIHAVIESNPVFAMKTILRFLAPLIAALVLPGCLQYEATVRLQKDGSGTFEEQTLLGAQMMAMLNQFAAMGGEAAGEDPLADMMSEEKAKERAAKLGEGVTFDKAERVEKNGAMGVKITYRFKDINKLQVTTSDGLQGANPMADMAPADMEKPKEEPFRFAYDDGKLTVSMPQQDKEEAKKAAAEAKEAAGGADMPDMDNPEAEAMMKQMLGDMRVSLKLVVEPGIGETDASHRDGNTITLMEMDMGKLVENKEAFKKLATAGQDDPAKAMEALKGIDGVKIETKEKITVKID